ncbi:interleukin-17 receptor A isoform X2 [Varanus komodoensis]|uniref:interleukin-17 receptor A isoform X2 n=1 Tax=Varanus komodoensis TaxID=61221 RepID=UPI001CF795D2|nr:interleukin-17 receptor A isoform X2 [Varanus komodoensis]
MGAAPALLFALLLRLGSTASGLRLLLNHPPVFNCSQPGLHCLVQNSTCMDQSWLKVSTWTPSAPSSLNVQIGTFFGMEGKLLPVLQIDWKVATDGSIQHLKGVELSVLQVNVNQQVCAQFNFLNSLLFQVRPNGGGRWNFSFNRFEVQPGQKYHVTIYHLPKLSTSGDHNQKSMEFTVPDCTDPIMKSTTPCLQIGSLWEPRIEGKRLDDGSLLVSFNPALESASYIIHVTSYQEGGKECEKTIHKISEEVLPQRQNVTVKLERMVKSCCEYRVQIQPFFAVCASDCMRHSVFIPCPLPTVLSFTDEKMKGDGYLSVALPWGLTLVCILLVVSAVAVAVCLVRRPKANAGTGTSDNTGNDDTLGSQPLQPLKACKIWIVYSADHKLYVDVVMRFAEFLMTVCGTEVVLDRLDERQISEMGPIRWLTRQKQEMEELSSKIIILCSQGTRAKWQAMLGRGERGVCLKQDNHKPIGDMFTPALNLILPDFKQPACFGMYLVCYFEGISSERDIPEPFNVTSKYQLMDKFEEIYFLIQDMEKFEPGRIHQIPEISREKYMESPSGRQLKEAIQKFQKLQTEDPNWFKRQNACSEDHDDLQSLNGELSEELVSAKGRILRQQLLLREPDPSSCCLVNLLVSEDDLGVCRLLPQPLPEEDPTFQTLVVPADETSQVQMVMPIVPVEKRSIFSNQLLPNEEWLERAPLLETSIPRRNKVIIQDDVSSDPQPLPVDVRQQLEGLMYSVYQQSITPSELSVCQESVNAQQQQQLDFDNSCKDQRQSVQSDQGYISRCSPLLSDGPMEKEEVQEQEGHGSAGYLSADILDSLKHLQQELLFQDIQQNFS